MELTKAIAKELLKKDFIPPGDRITIQPFKFRPTEDNEVYRCCCGTGRGDPQSGPFFCGDIADFIMDVIDENGKLVGVYALCGKGWHRPFKCGNTGRYIPLRIS